MDTLLKFAVALGIAAVGAQSLAFGLATRDLPAVALAGGGVVALVAAVLVSASV